MMLLAISATNSWQLSVAVQAGSTLWKANTFPTLATVVACVADSLARCQSHGSAVSQKQSFPCKPDSQFHPFSGAEPGFQARQAPTGSSRCCQPAQAKITRSGRAME